MPLDHAELLGILFGAELGVESFEGDAAKFEFWLQKPGVRIALPTLQPTGRVHSRYHRVLGDAPIGGTPVVLHLTLHRF